MVTIQSQTPTNGKISDLAYQPNEWDITENGFIIFRKPLVVKAQLKLFKQYFLPSPTNNLMLNIINDDMMKANKIVILEKKIVKRNRVIIIGSVSIATYIAIQVLISSLK